MRESLRKWTVAALTIALTATASSAAAQSGPTGSLTGRVSDQSQSAVPGVTVTATNMSTNDTRVDVTNGEGVFGLRRALVLAGAESQMMSLWPVSDRSTSDLMAGYYRALLAGQGRGESLRQVQLQMLKSASRAHPYYWASFIESGEWANLQGQR